ncbi:MAG: hypothetical protein R6U85_00545 [Salinivirgaceae bacterium]
MMKKVFSISLALMLLASHMSLVIGTHYCGGMAVESEIVFGASYLSCDMAEMEQPSTHSEAPGTATFCFENIPCCENEFRTIQLTDEFIKEAVRLNFEANFVWFVDYPTLDLNVKVTAQPLITLFSMPPIEKDIQVLFQTFLI